MPPQLNTALRVARWLEQLQIRLVLAESCTAGNVAGTLACIPGISRWLCGSLVVYRNDSKHQWLGINSNWLDDPQIGPVSSLVTRALARSALHRTPEAHVAAAVTGHVGPGAPPELDGLVFFCLATRDAQAAPLEKAYRLTSPEPRGTDDLQARQVRLQEATQWVLQQIEQALAAAHGSQ